MTENNKNRLINRAVTCMSSMSLLVFLFLLSLYLFPKLTVSVLSVLTLLFLCRYLPSSKQAPEIQSKTTLS